MKKRARQKEVARHNPDETGSPIWRILIPIFLVAAVFVIYWQVQGYEFINLDDPLYVTENDQVQAGLSSESMAWAFTAAFETVGADHFIFGTDAPPLTPLKKEGVELIKKIGLTAEEEQKVYCDNARRLLKI